MARLSVQYKKYANSKGATFFSFLGGLLQTLFLYGAVVLLVLQLLSLVTGSGTVETFFSALVVVVALFVIGVLCNAVFQKLALALGRSKQKSSGHFPNGTPSNHMPTTKTPDQDLW